MAAAALATNTAMAATTLNVPFSFTVAGKSLPAGDYLVQKDISGNTVTLRSEKSTDSLTWVIGPGDPSPSDNRIQLQFNQSASGHVLRTIQYGALITSRLDRDGKRADHIPSSGR
jgi:hypothetical protein